MADVPDPQTLAIHPAFLEDFGKDLGREAMDGCHGIVDGQQLEGESALGNGPRSDIVIAEPNEAGAVGSDGQIRREVSERISVNCGSHEVVADGTWDMSSDL